MNSRHSPAFCRFFACALTFWALCTGAPAYAVPLPAGAAIEISRLDGSTNCFGSYMHYRITGLAINTRYDIKFDVAVQQQGGVNGVYSRNGVVSHNSNDSGVIEEQFTMGFFDKPNNLCADLKDAPFTISLRAGASPNYNEIATPPKVVSGWGGTPTMAPVGTATPSSTTISASGNACTDASLHIVLEGLTPDSGYIFSALDVALTQGSSTGTLQLTDWLVMTDSAGRYEGDVPLSSFSPASGITCADLAVGTPFDVKLTATLPGGAAVDGTTQHTFPLYTIDVARVAGGTVTCDAAPHGGSADCRVTPDTAAGYTFDRLDIVDDPAGTATLGTCSTGTPITCPISNVTGNVRVQGVFKQAPPQPQPQPQPQQPQQPRVISDTPTMSDVGLLLSGLALAGAAVPALRRREKQGKKADTGR